MRIYYGIDEYDGEGRGASVALGYFDGVHLGHRAVISACAAGCGGAEAVALTFTESPAKALGRSAPPALTDNAAKARLMELCGASAVIFEDFTAIKDMSAEDFVRTVLRDKLRAVRVCCGYNYRFGREGSGDTEKLMRLCAEEGIGCRVCEPVSVGTEAVSSTAIRELLASGDIENANAMLGYSYAVSGEIKDGNHIGTAMGYPTVNIPLTEGLCVPRYGVYASRVDIDGRRYKGATNIGVHPTVGENPAPLCETFIIDFNGESLYGKNARVELLKFLRPEMRFGSLDELREQVRRDVGNAEKV